MVSCAPTPGRTRQLSDDEGTPLNDSSGPKGVMDTDGPAWAGTEGVVGQGATGSLLCVLR